MIRIERGYMRRSEIWYHRVDDYSRAFLDVDRLDNIAWVLSRLYSIIDGQMGGLLDGPRHDSKKHKISTIRLYGRSASVDMGRAGKPDGTTIGPTL
jgi:hypothetical protein